VNPPAPAPRSLWRNEIVWLLVGIVVLVLGVNIGMVWFALRHAPSLVQEDYYDASKRYDSEHAARLASERLGWTLGDVPALRERGRFALRITDAQGRPVSGLAGSIQAYRPSNAALDQTLQWHEDPAQPGQYVADFARPASGLWRITVDLSLGAQRLYRDLTLVTP
jgi:nitrogen fixation protein FixH